jgi:DNA primase
LADEIDEIRARVNIVDLVSQSVLLKKTGNRYQGLCPFHQDRNPSFSVTPETGRYKCWSCGETGDVFNWVMKTRNVEFVEALQVLAELAGVVLKTQNPKERTVRMNQRSAMAEALAFFQEQLPQHKEAVEYCASRSLAKDILEKWEIGYAPDGGEALTARLRKKGFKLADCKTLFLVDGSETQGYYDKFRRRLMFPIRDEKGDLVAFGGRIIGDGQPKYINSSDTPLYKKSKVLYAMNVAKEAMRTEREAVLVEGYLDVIACHCAGVNTAFASLGTSLTQDHAKLLRRWCDAVTVLYDSDTAGQKAAERATEILSAEGLRVRIASVPEGKDPDTLLKAAGPEAVKLAAKSSLTPLEYRVQLLKKEYSYADDEFWKLAVAAIAGEIDELQRARFIDNLAPAYPKIRDAAHARTALREQVDRARRATPEYAVINATGPRPSRPVNLSLSLKAAEVVVFGAVLDAQFRTEIWPFLQDDAHFLTPNGRRLAAELVKSFPDGPPAGAARQWLPETHKGAQELLAAVEQDERTMGLSKTIITDATAYLKRKLDERIVQNLKEEQGEGRLQEIMSKLQPHKL